MPKEKTYALYLDIPYEPYFACYGSLKEIKEEIKIKKKDKDKNEFIDIENLNGFLFSRLL